MPTLLSYRPELPIAQVLTWQTSVLKSLDGTEHRQAVITKPRERYELTYLLTEGQTRAIRALLFNSPTTDYEIPAWHEETEIQAEVTGTTVDIGGAGEIGDRDWMGTDQRVYLIRPDGTGETNSIASASSNISLNSGVGSSFPAGSSILPLRAVRIPGDQAIARWSVNLARWQAVLEQDEFVDTWGSGASLTTVVSLPVLERQPISREPDPEQVFTGTHTLDFGATLVLERDWDFSDFGRQLLWHVEDHSDRQYWRLFLDTVIGGQGDFWLSTWRDDLPLASQPGGGASEITTVDPPDYDTDWFPSLAHKRIALHLVDDTVIYRGISSAVDNGNTQTLTLDSATPGGMADVDRVSFLERCRLGDEVRFLHDGGHQQTSQVAAQVRVVQQ